MEEPIIKVGVIDRTHEVDFLFQGLFRMTPLGRLIPGSCRVYASKSGFALCPGEGGAMFVASETVSFDPEAGSIFSIDNVTIGINFHWERKERQTFRGSLCLELQDDGTMTVINQVRLEAYLVSVVSSEMRAGAPLEFLKAHAIASRSWLAAMLDRGQRPSHAQGKREVLTDDRIVRWYEREDHDRYDVCADDHCQRYQGITKVISVNAERAVEETTGLFLTHGGKVCDARFYKACGGLTESYENVWADHPVPYLVSLSDGSTPFAAIGSEKDAADWIAARPDAFCNIADRSVLEDILPDFDRGTEFFSDRVPSGVSRGQRANQDGTSSLGIGDSPELAPVSPQFFRWQVTYRREELEEIIQEKSGLDFGALLALEPERRGPSGRIIHLIVRGTKKTVTVGKELEIRRWLSRSHLPSSAFVVEVEHGEGDLPKGFTLRGAGWGHGVGLCQIGAAMMALKGFTAQEILRHYFPGTTIEKYY